MSTNRTENYGLHAWVAGDDFLREEINENFEKLDDSSRSVVGSYIGDGWGTRDIVLGFSPKAVLFMEYTGKTGYSSGQSVTYGGLVLPGCPLGSASDGGAAELTDTGFRLHSTSWRKVNEEDTRYHYIALR